MKLVIISLSLLLSVSVFAQNAESSKDHPCAADVKKFCSGVEKGQGRIAKCLKEHEKEISPACTEKMAAGKEKMKARAKEIVESCKEELQKFCKEVKPGGGAKLKCLESHKAEVGEKCKAALPNR